MHEVQAVDNSMNLYCKLYVDTELDRHALTALLAGVMAGEIEDFTIVCSSAEIDVRINPNYDAHRRSKFPDGFLAFLYYLDITTACQTYEQFIDLVSRLLESLWACAIPTVAACDFESELPNQGGYRSRDVPWPGCDDEQGP
jgi:hypothetical protein